MNTPQILVIGLGNLLASDEGVGVHLIRQLLDEFNAPENFELIDGGTLGFELLERIENCDDLILIDAVNTKEQPGTIIILKDDEIPAYFEMKVSPHQQSFQEILAYGRVKGTVPHVTLLGIQPHSTQTGVELSDLIESRLPVLKEKFYELIQPYLVPGASIF